MAKMKLRTLIDALSAIDRLLPQIKKNYQLAYKLGRIKSRMEGDVEEFYKTRTELIKENGKPMARFASRSEVIAGAELVQQEGDDLIYDVDPSQFDAIKKKYPKIREISRDYYKIPDQESQQKVTDAINLLLDTEVDTVPPVKLSMFDGVEADGLGEIIQKLGVLVLDDEDPDPEPASEEPDKA